MTLPDPTAPISNPSGGGDPSRNTGMSPGSAAPIPGAAGASRVWVWAIAAGLLAGLLCWGGGEIIWGRVRSAQTPRIVPFPTAADRDRVIWGQVRSTASSFIQQGAILGIVLGLAGGLARRSARAMLIAAIAGGLLGAAAATGAAYGLLPVYYRNVEPQENALGIPMITHGAIWGAAGAAAGLAFGLGLGGRGRWARCALGGLMGGVAATMIYDLIGAMAFPLDKTSQPISATVHTRLIAHLAVGLLSAAGAAMAGEVRAISRPSAST
jgi:hypothetical protein